jgi:glycosyltransferase 2 family protein
MVRRPLWIALGLCIGGIFLWTAAERTDLRTGFAVALDADLQYQLLAMAASLAFVVLKTMRWAVMLAPVRRFTTLDLLPAVYAGTALNLIVSHAGELARAAIVSKRHKVATSHLLGSIALERIFDIVAVLLFVALLAAATETLPSAVLSASYFAILVLAVALPLAVVGLLWTDLALRVVAAFLFFLPASARHKVLWHLRSAVQGLNTVREARLMPAVIALSLLQWGSIVVAILASTLALGLTVDALSAIAVLVLLVVGLTLPTAPVHVGTTQLGFMFGLAAFHVTSANAFAASMIYTSFVLLPMLVLGLAALYRSRLQWRAMESTSP